MIGQEATMFSPPPIEEAPESPPDAPAPPRRKIAYLAIATDTLAAIGLVAGIIISGVSLYVLLHKYFGKRAQPPPPTG